MPKPRKPTRKSDSPSVPTEGRSVVIGGNVTNSNIVLADNVNIQSGKPPLSVDRIAQLTEEYKRAVERDWSVLRVNESEIPLKVVFVMLQAVASSPPKDLEKRPELAELPERMKHAGFVPNESHPVPVELSQALKTAQHLVLLGEPGSGKSTTLQFIGLCFVHENWAQDRLQLTEQRIPIKLELRGYADILAESGPAMEKALSRAVREFLRDIGEEEAYELVRTWRDQGRLLVLFDGLDEAFDQHKGAVRDEIQKFASWGADQQCRLVVSSRLAGYSTIGGKFKEFTLKPFEHAEEAIPYLQSWLTVLQPDWGLEQVQTGAVHLHKRMRDQPALYRILDNPLLLRIAVQIYARGQQIARSRSDLYDLYTDDLWLRAVERGADRAKKDKVWTALEDLAWGLQMNDAPNISMEMHIIIREKMGLAVQMGERLAFSHTTLQEFFVAKRLVRAWHANQARTWAFLRPRLHYAIWREPLLLLCGSLDGGQASELLQRVMRAHSPYEHQLHRDKILTALLLSENSRAYITARKRLTRYLLRALKLMNPNWRVRAAAAWALGNIGAVETVPDLLHKMKNDDRRVLVYAADALRKMGAMPDLLRALKNEDWRVSRWMVEALGEIRALEAVPALMAMLKDKHGTDWHLTVMNALSKIEADEAVPDMHVGLRDEDWHVRLAASEALEKIGKEAVPDLIAVLRDEDWHVRRAAGEALGKIGKEAVPDLIAALRDEDWHVRLAAGEALGKIGKEAVPDLRLALKDRNRDVRLPAAQALREIGKETVLDMIAALKDEDAEVRYVAATALQKNNSDEAITALVQALWDENGNVCLAAAEALIAMKSAEVVPALIAVLRDGDGEARLAAAQALVMIGKRAVPELIVALNDEDEWMRWLVAEALGEIKATEGAPALIGVLRDEKIIVRSGAAKALGNMKAVEAAPELCEALRDESSRVRAIAAEALGKIKAVEAVTELVKMLRDKDEDVRRAVAMALGAIREVDAVPALIRALDDENWKVRQVAAEALKEIIVTISIPAEKKEQQEQVVVLRKLMASKLDSDDKLLVAEQLAMLNAFSSPSQDPFEPVKPSFAWKALRLSLVTLAIIFVLGLLAVLDTLYGTAQDVFKNLLTPTISAWIDSNRSLAVAVIIGLVIASGWLIWWVDRLKDAFMGKSKS